MLHFFSFSAIRTALTGHEIEIVEEFKRLCTEDVNFLGAIERTTKTNEANHFRFNKWADSIGRIGNITVTHLDFGL